MMGLEEYMSYLLSSPEGSSCVKAGEVLEISHDQVNRFLLQGTYSGKDLFDKTAPHLVLTGGTLTVDDTVLDKPYSQLDGPDQLFLLRQAPGHGQGYQPDRAASH